MVGEVVHNDDVAKPESWDENLGVIGFEGIAVDRSVENERRDEVAQGQSAYEGRCPPVVSGTQT